MIWKIIMEVTEIMDHNIAKSCFVFYFVYFILFLVMSFILKFVL